MSRTRPACNASALRRQVARYDAPPEEPVYADALEEFDDVRRGEQGRGSEVVLSHADTLPWLC